MITGAKKKALSPKEKEFAQLLSEGCKVPEAARRVFGWKCEKFTPEDVKARALAQSRRVKDYVSKVGESTLEKAVIEETIDRSKPTDWDNLHLYAYKKLIEIRDDPNRRAQVRYEALLAIEKLSDPAQDINLIWKYIETVWQGLTAHCPCCHEDFPLAKIKNERLEEHLKFEEKQTLVPISSETDRRLYLLDLADRRRSPKNHPGQMVVLTAPERHIIVQGSARIGKSLALAGQGLLHLMIPGSNVWILARTYDDARWEFEYICNFLYTMFYPVQKYMYNISLDRKGGDVRIVTKWGAELEVRSGKSKGSITGQELDAILVAEPGWVEADLFEEVRARMSSRLGRIFAFGTPKGFGNFLGRMTRMASRDLRTGKKLPTDSLRIENGCSWGKSVLLYHFKPEQNPEYVQSELDVARSELTDAEFASEFEGVMVQDKDKKFPFFRPSHLQKIMSEQLENCTIVVGVDQGTRNFAGIIIGWDGDKVYVLDEYFDNSGDNTIKAHLIKFNFEIPGILMSLRVPSEKWALTIFDVDPKIDSELEEMKNEGKAWKTNYTFKPKNEKDYMNWREETCQFINILAKADRIVFCAATEMLLEDAMEVVGVPDNRQNENSSKTRKGWIVSNQWRGDHVLDAFLLAMWTIYQKMSIPAMQRAQGETVYEHIQKQQEFDMKKREAEELKGFTRLPSEQEMFKDTFGYEAPKSNNFLPGKGRYHYNDA